MDIFYIDLAGATIDLSSQFSICSINGFCDFSKYDSQFLPIIRYDRGMFLRTVTLISAIAFAAACGGTPSNQGAPGNMTVTVVTPDPNETPPAAVTAAGKKLYLANCALCHKETGVGGKMEIEGKSIKPDDLTSDKIKEMPDDKIYGYVFKGIEDEGMPAFKDKLSEAEIREVVRYIRVEFQKMPGSATKRLAPQ